jgi:lysine-N-methylase
VPIDREAYERYQQMPASPLRELIEASIKIASTEAAKGSAPSFAIIRMNEENQCPLLTETRLCRIHAECGEELLAHTCATYPRIVHKISGIDERSLALSCPEAARLVLLDPALLLPDSFNNDILTMIEEPENAPGTDGCISLLPWFWSIRESVLSLVRNRKYPLWQRMFLLGVFCRRLDSIANGELQRTVPRFLADFEATVTSGGLVPAMETLPLDREAQLDIVLQLAGMLLERSNIRPRFIECVQAFTAGIGNGPTATLQSLTNNYAVAHDRHFAPFFDRQPHILENYLVNTLLRLRFPFGREGTQTDAPVSMAREFALVTAQFALMKGLLIGVAGHYREGFSAAHVVHTMQAASKHFEHHPQFLDMAYALLVESRMDGARGLAILLRNAEPQAQKPTGLEIHAPGAWHVSQSPRQ